jgi:5-enolpyruvylshikimate-3-phosphate synthase
MALAVAGLVASGETVVQDVACIADSFPGFEALLGRIANLPNAAGAGP